MLKDAGVEVVAYTHLRNISRPCCTCCGNLTQFEKWVEMVKAAGPLDGILLDNMDTVRSSSQPYHPDGYHQMVRIVPRSASTRASQPEYCFPHRTHVPATCGPIRGVTALAHACSLTYSQYAPAAAIVRKHGLAVWANGPHVS